MAERHSRRLARLVALSVSGLLVLSTAFADDQPKACAKDVSADTGKPVMFQRGPLTWGLSTRPVVPGQKLLVLLWLYNPTDQPLPVATCDDIDFFWFGEIEVVDSTGKPVLSKAEEKRRTAEKQGTGRMTRYVFDCLRNFSLNVPPHTCLHGTFSKPEYDFARDLNEYYLLAPGRYSLVLKKEPNPGPASPGSTKPSVELPITVLNP